MSEDTALVWIVEVGCYESSDVKSAHASHAGAVAAVNAFLEEREQVGIKFELKMGKDQWISEREMMWVSIREWTVQP